MLRRRIIRTLGFDLFVSVLFFIYVYSSPHFSSLFIGISNRVYRYADAHFKNGCHYFLLPYGAIYRLVFPERAVSNPSGSTPRQQNFARDRERVKLVGNPLGWGGKHRRTSGDFGGEGEMDAITYFVSLLLCLPSRFFVGSSLFH